MTPFPHDHEEIAWSHFLAQHLGKDYTEAFVRAFYPPLNVLDKAQNDLYTLRWLETAVGAQLDGIGYIVGQSRVLSSAIYLPFFGFITQPSGRAFGVARMRHEGEPYADALTLADAEYRSRIILKISLNNSHGTAEDLIIAVSGILGIPKADVEIRDIGNANFRIYIAGTLILPPDYRVEILQDILPRAAGVQVFPPLFL